MPKMFNGDIEFTAKESADGICPICQSHDLDYGCSEIIDTGIVYPFTCRSCKAGGRQYDKSEFDGYEVSYVPEGIIVPNLQQIKRVAIIEDGFVRDAQVFTADPVIIEKDPDWENNFSDLKAPCHFVGIFEGIDEDEILVKAAEHAGVYPDVISLIEI